ncbi:serine/threonine-protein kinase ICK-like isoform X2 [Saccostrea cucullata]|uniref:serine/threonine-protein kinase ICK-like isoform X2 n=1 Tax=Saccostrea cuccullata TaxID=36930 RepID=UPI002ED3364A
MNDSKDQQSTDDCHGHDPVSLTNGLEEPMEIEESGTVILNATLDRLNAKQKPTSDGDRHKPVLLISGQKLEKKCGAESMDTNNHERHLAPVKKAKDKLTRKSGKGVTPMDVDNKDNNLLKRRVLDRLTHSGYVDDFHFLKGEPEIQTSKRSTFEKGKVVYGEVQALQNLLDHQEKLNNDKTGVIIKELSSDIRNFTEIERVGNGVYGEVFHCQDRATGKPFALKKISRNFNVEEVKMLMRLEHENIITLYGFIKKDRVALILMEYGATNLENFFLNLQMNLMDEKLIWSIIKQGLCALEYLDQNHIMHFDLKPDNICITASMVVKLTDFGSAIRNVTEKDTLACTPEYMSPEMCYFVKPNTNVSKTDMPLTGKSDVFAFGLVIQYILDREHTQLKFYGKDFNDIGQLRICIIINNAKDPDTVLNKMITKNGNVAIRLLLERLLQGWPKNRHSAEQALSVMKDYMLGPMAK